ncbi:MAG: hypothetical protein EOO80_17310 [Oxalobacteraceae bacterium]|nr:MAG: hypothetical protein EOO80_17310 [Oxalobacteraceae bacterium]
MALVVLVIGGIAANALGGRVRRAGARSRMHSHEVPGGGARWAVWGFTILVAVNQVGNTNGRRAMG